jgi:hypothetical protein
MQQSHTSRSGNLDLRFSGDNFGEFQVSLVRSSSALSDSAGPYVLGAVEVM